MINKTTVETQFQQPVGRVLKYAVMAVCRVGGEVHFLKCCILMLQYANIGEINPRFARIPYNYAIPWHLKWLGKVFAPN